MKVLLGGRDCYALRCSFLHQGLGDISNQRAREVLPGFHFVRPLPGKNIVHRNIWYGALQLQVDCFCEDICVGVEQWEQKKLLRDPKIQVRASKMLRIVDFQDLPRPGK